MRGRRRRGPPPSPIEDTGDPEGLAALALRYADWMRVHNFSPGTVKDRLFHLRAFVTWCAERGVTRPAEVTRPVLESFQRFLFLHRKPNGSGLAFTTQQGRLLSVKGLFRYMARESLILSNPAADLELPKVGTRIPREVLTADEVERVLAQADLGRPLGLRDRAILETFYSTGMRRAELAALQVWDLDAERGTVLIQQGKGKRDRVVPIGDRAVWWVKRYLREVRPELVVGSDPGHLFLNDQGESLGPAWLTVMVRRYVEKAAVGKRGACHLFRHSMATLMLEGGADVRYIQEMLGHARLDTTQVYTQVSIRALKAIHAATHPANLPRPASPLAASVPADQAEDVLDDPENEGVE